MQVFRRTGSKDESARFKLRGLSATTIYGFKVWVSPIGWAKTFDGQLFDCTSPPVPIADSLLAEGQTQMTGQQLMEQGLLVNWFSRLKLRGSRINESETEHE